MEDAERLFEESLQRFGKPPKIKGVLFKSFGHYTRALYTSFPLGGRLGCVKSWIWALGTTTEMIDTYGERASGSSLGKWCAKW